MRKRHDETEALQASQPRLVEKLEDRGSSTVEP